ncbi:MAG: ATP-binding protein [Campylobacterota bacterium]|nr:ATP-binding protein [Campylobacterota bacterium]
MKHIVFSNSDKKEIKSAIKEANKEQYRSKLIQIFTSITNEIKLKKLLNKYTKKFPNTIIIGTTTAGEISHAKMFDNSTIISLSLFKETNLKAKYIKNINKEAGLKLSSKICSKNTKATIILSESLKGQDYDGFIKGFKEKNPNIILAGGLAGDNFKLQKTYVFLDDTIYDEGSVAVSFSSKTLYADNRYNLNWTPIGKEFTITLADGNIIHKIDNQNSVEFFKKYLGDDIFADGAKALSEFQLLYTEGSTIVSRTPMAIDGESLIFAAPIKEGQKVQFGFSNADAVLAGSSKINSMMKKNPAEGVYIYSCIARKTLLGDTLENEFKSFEQVAPTAGFFTYGEYYSTSKNNAVLNCTTTLLILSESNKKAKQKKHNMSDITFSALTHLVKQTADELSSNVKLLNQYKDAVDESLLVSKTDKDGVITFVNDNFCRVSQYSREELIGKKHSIVRDDNVSAFIFKKMWTAIQNGKTWRGSFPNRAKDGSVYYVNATIMPTYDDNKNIDGFIAIRQDTTKQVLAKKKMQEKEKLIKAIFDNQDNIVIFTSNEGDMINANQTLFKYFSYKNFAEFKLEHKCICELFMQEDGYVYVQKDKNWIEEILQDRDTDHKVKMLTKHKKVHTFNITIKKIDNGYIINLSDITNLENALLKAYSSEQAKTTFLANMSHEIRTPLNGILGFTDVLNKKQLDKDSKRYVDIISKSGKTLLNVVNDILDFSKLESGELSIYETESNLFSEMEATVSTFASTSKSKKIDYYTYIDTNIPKTLKCDSQRIKQVVNNLISNAIKFTPEGGKVGVNISLKEIKNKKAIIEFSVKDSGIGIAKDKISSVFQAFSQADDSISRKYGGTGLGLSISSQYIQIMGDKLKVKSKEGEGSNFYFKLKLPIIDATYSVKKDFDATDKNIYILQAKDSITCGINKVVETYLDRWQCNYQTIDSLDQINDKMTLLIVCAKIFDYDLSYSMLEEFKNLHIIYIEGGEEKSCCIHPQFHIIEQPMTGSALFDKIITLTHNNSDTTNSQINTDETKKFDGDILIAEDNQTNQILIAVMLDEREVNYKIVENGQEVVDEALQKSYNLIFMDINMPVIDGVTATKILREKGYTQPIVSLSANVIESDVKTYIEAGVDDSLSKPIITAELDTILERYLENKIKKTFANLKFDVVNLEQLTVNLSLPNQDIVLKLLNSFSESAQELIKTIDTKGLNEDNIHSIKGLSGNLRFNKLFKLIKEMEHNFENWDEIKNKQNSETIKSHLNEAIKNIDLLNK